MGWDTQIIIIAEHIESKELSKKIGKLIFDKDSKRYARENFYLIEEEFTNSIYYSYERRKYAPYWSIEEISKIYPSVTFTLLGSMLDFLCGPGGIFKIYDGKTIDSYGIYGENSRRHKIIDSPVENRYLIYKWFKESGKESQLRKNFIADYPIGSSNDNLIDKVIPIQETLELQTIKNESIQIKNNWIKQARFSPIISFNDFQELKRKSNQTKITEESFVAYVAYSETVSRIEEKFSKLVKCEIIETNPYNGYALTFGTNGKNEELSKNKFKFLGDIEQNLNNYSDQIVEWGVKNLKKKTEIKLVKGFSITWLINLIKENE